MCFRSRAAAREFALISIKPNVHKFVFDHMVLPHGISELPNSDPEIRSIKIYKSRLVEEVIPIGIVKT
jgi:hypothetical protein